MRQLLLKNLVSKNKKRTELLLSEYHEAEGVTQYIEKRTVYSVKHIFEFTHISDIELFLEQKKKENIGSQTFIVRKYDSHRGGSKFIHKTQGLQYVILKDKVFILEMSQCIKKIVMNSDKKFISN